jgi:ACS family hexuronate transporter-like MFS transporter
MREATDPATIGAGGLAGAAALPVETGFKVRGLRWWIVGLVFLATVINYIDRQTVSVLSPVILRDLHLSKIDYGNVVSFFLLAYTISQSVSGKMFDRIGTRRGFAASITLWSVAAMLHAFATGFRSLSACRFLLGLGEAGNWPGAAKCVAEWFPVRERAFGMAIFNSGATLGAVVAPPVIVWLQLSYGWPRTFLFTGLLGFLWLAAWLVLFRTPERHPWLTRSEAEHIKDTGGVAQEAEGESGAGEGPPMGWLELLRYRQVWAIVLARFFTDPIWWLYIAWLPQYLFDARGFDLKAIGAFAWLPFLAADMGALGGGFLSGHLIKRGWSVDRARKTCMLVGALLMPAGVFAVRVESPWTALGLVSVVLFAFQFWINNVQTLPSDLFPRRMIGSVFGLGGTAAGISSMLFTNLTGQVVQRFSYTPIFTVAGLLGPLGALALFTLMGRIERVKVRA